MIVKIYNRNKFVSNDRRVFCYSCYCSCSLTLVFPTNWCNTVYQGDVGEGKLLSQHFSHGVKSKMDVPHILLNEANLLYMYWAWEQKIYHKRARVLKLQPIVESGLDGKKTPKNSKKPNTYERTTATFEQKNYIIMMIRLLNLEN